MALAYTPFEQQTPTTMTLIFTLDGVINLPFAFEVLPITPVHFDVPKRQRKKIDLPHLAVPGAILSMRYSGRTRGVVRSQKPTYFKNSITIDLCSEQKNISIKLTKSKIHMCGASSEIQGREGAQLLLDHLLRLQDEMDYISNSPGEILAVLCWIENLVKGEETTRIVQRLERVTQYDEKKRKYVRVNVLVSDGERTDYKINTPLNLNYDDCPNPRIAKFILAGIDEYKYYSELENKIEFIRNEVNIIDRPLQICDVIKVMVNFNYKLGFFVDRYSLGNNMPTEDGFFVSYDNCVDYSVKIKLPYAPDKLEEKTVRKKNKVKCHCFLVYKSGVVTQTGPGGERMKYAYDLFWKNILKIKESIMLKETINIPIRRTRKKNMPALPAPVEIVS